MNLEAGRGCQFNTKYHPSYYDTGYNMTETQNRVPRLIAYAYISLIFYALAIITLYAKGVLHLSI